MFLTTLRRVSLLLSALRRLTQILQRLRAGARQKLCTQENTRASSRRESASFLTQPHPSSSETGARETNGSFFPKIRTSGGTTSQARQWQSTASLKRLKTPFGIRLSTSS